MLTWLSQIPLSPSLPRPVHSATAHRLERAGQRHLSALSASFVKDLMAANSSGVLRGVLMLGLITLGGVAVVWCVLSGPRLLAWAVAAGRLLRILPPLPPTPLGMPIERISADLRRIRAGVLARAEGMTMVQRRAILAAYDDALMDACRALGVDADLDAMNDDLERESERLRTEAQLERAGIDLG